ncbi:M56 family metallopeptidase [Proteiniborus sp. MB09-C3]|uniref:M56 family metallopeptidase n=1 Tax=Proteiniborus sp. MB09-C3 TaxID=3050072 RepID=UPI00255213EA|nr:M56 family metallopeptidase [Proteiniborus sp. MB09-C3]WIV12899.1 M56 family metallopeptidase [Proteiniborus sp. MB09-C3]
MKILNMVFNMSVTGSIMFLIFLLLKPITKKHFNSSWYYKMLILILTFFIISANNFIVLPINPISNISKLEIMEAIVPKNINIKEEIKGIENNISIEKEMPENAVEIEDKVTDKDINKIKTENQDFQDIEFDINNYKDMIQYIWMIGVITLLLLNLVPYIRFKSSVLRDSTIVEEEDIVKLFNICKEELNLKTKVQLRTCNTVGSPMLIGIFRPVVLIPDIDKDYKRLKMIFLHELNHYKRNDIIIKSFSVVINAVHWFNPLVYILLKEMDKYCEYSIDEKVVEEMDINDRKYYGETILSVVSSSMFKKASLTTAMGSSGKQLKTRLENMIYSFKITRKKQIMSLFAAILMLISGITIAYSILPDNTLEENASFVVFIKEDGLYYSYLSGENETKIHDGNNFEYPLISSGGNYIAYTKEDSFFIYSVKDESYEKIDDGIEHYYRSYDWIDDTSIIYGSGGKSGFTVLNVLSKERRSHLDEYYYTGLMSSKNDMVYGRKASRWTTAEGDFMANDGIVEISLNNYDENKKQFSTNIIVEGKKSTDETIGYNPVVWDISADGRYVYIMEKPASGSLSSDGIGIGIYDVKEKTHTEITGIDTSSYKNHLAINTNNNTIGLIEGTSRDMIENKKVMLLDIYKDKSYGIISITDEDFVAMTPRFTLDGKKLLYSATEAVDPKMITDYNQAYKDWQNQPHNIYEYDLKSSQVRKITEGNDFDFMPISISNNEILFIRYKGNDYYSLMKLVNGKENIMVDNIMFSGGKDNYPFRFYGHIQTEKGMDIFINKEGKLYTGVTSINQDNSSNITTDILEQLANQEFFIKGEGSSNSDDEVIVEFGKSFVNLFNGAVAKQKKVSFEKYISNENLQIFTDKMLELTQKQDIKGGNDVNYGLENKFGQVELRQHSVDKLWYLELPFQFEGSGMTAKLLITSEDKVLKLIDLYFGSKDGVDIFATGHPADRKLRDPYLWENED